MTIRTYIVTAGLLSASRNVLKDVEGLPGLDGMFLTALSPSSNLPATHYISSGIMSDAEVAFLEANLPIAFFKNNEGEGPFEILTRENLQLVKTTI